WRRTSTAPSRAREDQRVDIEPISAAQRVGVTRRRFVTLVGSVFAGTAAASLLAACGGGGQAPAAKPTEAPAKPAAPVPAASPGASPVASPGASPAASPAAAAAAATGPMPVAKSGSSLKILVWSHFVPAYDDWLDNYA